MKAVPVSELLPGMTVGRAVFDDTGRILLHQNVALTKQYIDALEQKGFAAVYIKDPDVQSNILIEEELDPALRARATFELREAGKEVEKEFASLKKASQASIKGAIDSDSVKALMGDTGPLASVMKLLGPIMEDVLSRPNVTGLACIRNKDTRVYDHSIQVCVVSLLIGHALGLEFGTMKQLAAGSLLHDIGKVFVNPEDNWRTRIVQHTTLGFALLKMADNPDILSPRVALEHHEYQDGTGLPRGTRGSNTIARDRSGPGSVPTLVGEITAIANIYDILTSGSETRAPMAPDEAVRVLRKAAGTHYNKQVVNTFLRLAPLYPVGTEVLVLSGPHKGFRALVARQSATATDRPTIVLVRDRDGNKIAHEIIELAKEKEGEQTEIRSVSV